MASRCAASQVLCSIQAPTHRNLAGAHAQRDGACTGLICWCQSIQKQGGRVRGSGCLICLCRLMWYGSASHQCGEVGHQSVSKEQGIDEQISICLCPVWWYQLPIKSHRRGYCSADEQQGPYLHTWGRWFVSGHRPAHAAHGRAASHQWSTACAELCSGFAALSMRDWDAELHLGLTHIAVQVSTQAQIRELRLVHHGDGDSGVWNRPSEPAAPSQSQSEYQAMRLGSHRSWLLGCCLLLAASDLRMSKEARMSGGIWPVSWFRPRDKTRSFGRLSGGMEEPKLFIEMSKYSRDVRGGSQALSAPVTAPHTNHCFTRRALSRPQKLSQNSQHGCVIR